MAGPLEGVRVIEVTSVVLGPLAAQFLGDMGADVVKVEPPAGDTTRQVGDGRHPGMTSYFMSLNRNKRSVVLDLKQPEGLRALLTLCEGADVLLHNLRPAAAARLGLGYDDVAARKPDIVYCATYGYRADGPYADYPAYDDIIQAASGIPMLQRMAGGEPQYAPTIMADKTTALTVVYSVCAALFHRMRTGRGQAIEVPMFETMVSFLMAEHLCGQAFEPPLGPAGYSRVLSRFRRPYQTSDGYLAVLPHTDAHWRSFLAAAGRLDLLEQERFSTVALRTRHIDALYEELDGIMATRSTAEWLELLDPAVLPVTPLNGPDDLIGNPQLEATGFWKTQAHPSEGNIRMTDFPVGFAGSPVPEARPAPRLGEHSLEVLREAGFGEAELERLLASGATRAATPPGDG